MEHEVTIKSRTVFIPTHKLDFTFYVRHCTVTYRAPEIPYGVVYEKFKNPQVLVMYLFYLN